MSAPEYTIEIKPASNQDTEKTGRDDYLSAYVTPSLQTEEIPLGYPKNAQHTLQSLKVGTLLSRWGVFYALPCWVTFDGMMGMADAFHRGDLGGVISKTIEAGVGFTTATISIGEWAKQHNKLNAIGTKLSEKIRDGVQSTIRRQSTPQSLERTHWDEHTN